MKSDLAELFKVAAAGTGGTVATIKLADVATLVSIAVGCVTFLYVAAKLYFLFKHNGRKPLD